MELKVLGDAGNDARLAMDISPDSSSTIILGEGKTASIISESQVFVPIGTFPVRKRITFLFRERPWSFAIMQENGQAFSTSSAEQNLQSAMLLSPDIVTIHLNYAVNQ